MRELCIQLMYIENTDISTMSVNARCRCANTIESILSELLSNSAKFCCIERHYEKDILKIANDVAKMYIPFTDDYKMYPGVALQLLKNQGYVNLIIDDIWIASKNNSDKYMAGIFDRFVENRINVRFLELHEIMAKP